MLHFVFLSEFAKVFTPYFRKSLLLTLDPFEYLFLNSIVICILCITYLAYRILFHNHKIELILNKYANMSPYQYLFAFIIACITIMTSMIIFSMDKYYNTPLVNNILFRIVSVILLLFTGVAFFGERYSYLQIFGFSLVIIGGSLVFYKKHNLNFANPANSK